MPVDVVRDAAVDVLLRVYERGMFLDAALDKTLHRKQLADRGRRFLTQLVYGTVRHTILCDHILRKLCRDPIEALPLPIHVILRMGVFQSLFLDRVTHPAMVHTSVELAKKRGHAGTARLVNAVLRQAPQDWSRVKLPGRDYEPENYLRLKYAMPEWLVRLWIAEHGLDGAEALCASSNEQAPLTLRVNTAMGTAQELIEHLGRSGITAVKQTAIPEEVTVVDGPSPLRTKWFQAGWFVVQDPASMLPGHLLEPRAGERVLDLCAAPGGKTTHLAQLAPEAQVAAMDLHPRRLNALQENTARLAQENILVCAADGTKPPFQRKFDRVLVDAPCSGLGTLRRHPDLKLRMGPEAVARLAAQQRELLLSAVALCENGGVIVYSVCTFTQAETQDVIAHVVSQADVAPEDGPELLRPWNLSPGCYRTLPSGGSLDGFFLTRLRKRS